MKKILLLVVVSCCWATAMAKPMVNIQHWLTPSKVPVYFVKRDHVPMLDVRVIFKAGSSYDDQHPGLAFLTNAMLNEGAGTKDVNALAVDFDRVGAVYSDTVGRDMATVGLRTLMAEQLSRPALQQFASILSQPLFPLKSLQRLKRQTLAAIALRQQNPNALAKKAMYLNLYLDQPYGHSVDGNVKSIKAISLSDIQSFYHRYYVQHNAMIVIVGALTKAQASAIAQNVVSGLASGLPAKRLPLARPLVKPTDLAIAFPTQQSIIYLAQLGINRQSADYFPLMVANHVLGGLPFNSLLFQQVRNQRGLAYYAYSTFQPLALRGPFYISMQTDHSKLPQAVQLLREVLQRYVTTGPTDAQLALAKDNMIGSFPLALVSNNSLLNIVTNIVFYHRPLDYLDHFRERVQSVSKLQVKQALQKHLQPNTMLLVTVGESSSTKKRHG